MNILKKDIYDLFYKKSYKKIIEKKILLKNNYFINDYDLLKIYFISCLKTNNFEYIIEYENYILSNVFDREIVLILIFTNIILTNYHKAAKISHFYLNKNTENKSSELSILSFFCIKKIKNISLNTNIENSVFLFSIYLRKVLFHDESILLLKHLIRFNNKNYSYFFHLGKCYQDLKIYKKSILYFHNSLKLKPDLEESLNSLSVCLIETGKYEKAKNILKNAIITNKNNKFFYSNLGKIYNDLDKFKESIKFYDLGLKIDAEDPIINFGKAICLLKLGKINESWKYLNYRSNGYLLSSDFNKKFNAPRLKNLNKIKNKNILVVYEQGLGDTIQFCRYIKILQEEGANVFFLPQKSLILLMKSLDKGIKIIKEHYQIPEYDFYIPLFDLPFLYYKKFGTFEYYKSYLSINKKFIEKWKKALPINKINIAICWKSSNEMNKSFSLSNFKNISKIKKINLISLQMDNSNEISNFKKDFNLQYFSKLDKNRDFTDSASLIKLVDLVITCDTSICHLSGSLNTKTWLILKKNPDWRWYPKNNIWYKNLKIFRQKYYFKWTDVFNEVYNNLIKEFKL